MDRSAEDEGYDALRTDTLVRTTSSLARDGAYASDAARAFKALLEVGVTFEEGPYVLDLTANKQPVVRAVGFVYGSGRSKIVYSGPREQCHIFIELAKFEWAKYIMAKGTKAERPL